MCCGWARPAAWRVGQPTRLYERPDAPALFAWPGDAGAHGQGLGSGRAAWWGVVVSSSLSAAAAPPSSLSHRELAGVLRTWRGQDGGGAGV